MQENPLRPSLLVLGSRGMLGSTLTPYLKEKGYIVYESSRFSESADIRFDPCDYWATRGALEQIQPHYVINLVGLTSVDECEQNPGLAFNVNVNPNLNLAAARRELRLDFGILGISSDHVYDGLGNSREDQVRLRNCYAVTKFKAELALQPDQDVVLRTNFVGKSRATGRDSLTDWLWDRAHRGARSKVIDDVFFSPLSMVSVSHAIDRVLKSFTPGIYNLGSRHGLSKAEFDFLFLEGLGLDHSLFAPIPKKDANFLVAPRPSDMRMDSTLFENTFSYTLPTLVDEVGRVTKEYLA